MTLREALTVAEYGDTITVDCPGTIQLTEGQLLVEKSLEIDGHESVTVDAGGQGRVFYVDAADVTIRGLTITGGAITGAEGMTIGGGGVYSAGGSLSIIGCTLTENTSASTMQYEEELGMFIHGGGGGIHSDGGVLIVTDSIVSNNSVSGEGLEYMAFGGGGGIYSVSGMLIVTNCEITGNTVRGLRASGGGIFNLGGTAVITGCMVSDNTATSTLTAASTISGNGFCTGGGGGIYNGAGTAPNADLGIASLTVADSSILRNTAVNAGGGGIQNNQMYYGTTTLTITGSTIAENNTTLYGGGIANTNSWGNDTITIAGTTISGNLAGCGGGAIAHRGQDSVVLLKIESSTISANTTQTCGGGIDSVETSQLQRSLFDLTINDSYILGNTAGQSGGGIHDTNDGESNVSLAGVTLSGNSSGDDGGGACLSSMLSIGRNSIISGNSAGGSGGGLSCHTLTLIDATVTENSAAAGGGGIDGREAVVMNSIVSNNSSGGSGGGLYCTTVTMTGSIVQDNVTERDGGGIAGELTLKDSTISGNKAKCRGGGVIGPISATDCVISENSAEDWGGGVCGSLSGTNIDIVENTGFGGGGGVHGDVSGSNIGILGNTTSAGDGGGISGDVSGSYITVAENSAHGNGGGVCGNIQGDDITVIANTASDGDGGGVEGDVTGNRIEISQNYSTADGGGVNGDVSGTNIQITRNTADGSGGGVCGDVSGTQIEISENMASIDGGGIHGSVAARDLTISSNEAGRFGGGISGYTCELIAATVRDNRASLGGGIYNDGWSGITLVSSRVTGNSASGTEQAQFYAWDYPRSHDGNVPDYDRISTFNDEDDDGRDDDLIWAPGHNIFASDDIEQYASVFDAEDGGLFYDLQPEVESVDDLLVPLVQPTSLVMPGNSVTLDASASLGAASFAWDTDNDGEFADASPTAQVTLSWEEMIELGWSTGQNVLAVKVLDEEGHEEIETISVTIAAEGDPEPERLARVIAYQDWKEGALIGYGGYKVDHVLDGTGVAGAGFYAIALARDVPEGSERDPFIVFRGTDCSNLVDGITGILTDLNEEGVGYDKYEAHKGTIIDNWITTEYAGETVDLVGHSLGGALCQWFAADLTSSGVAIGNVYTYNSPGIAEDSAASFLPDLCEGVRHSVVNGDIVSLADEAFIDGTVNLYSYDEGNVLAKHSRPVEIAESNGLTRPTAQGDHFRVENISVEELSGDWFFYDDTDYLRCLAGAQAALIAGDILFDFGDTYDDSVKYLPAKLFFRKTTEDVRQEIGKTIYTFLHVDPETTDIVIDRISFSRGWELRDIKIHWQDLAARTIEIEAELQFPRVGVVDRKPLIIGVKLGVAQGKLNTIGGYRDGLNMSLPFGLYLQTIGATVEHLAAEEIDPAPVEVSGSIGVTYGQEIPFTFPNDFIIASLQGNQYRFSIAALDGTLTASRDKCEMSGDLIILAESLVHGEGKLKYDWSKGAISGTGSLDVLFGLIDLDANILLKEINGIDTLSARGTGAISIPDDIPLVGGSILQTGEGGIFFNNDGNFENDHIYVKSQTTVFDKIFVVGLDIYFDGDYSTKFGFGPWSPGSDGATTGSAVTKDGSPITMLFLEWDDDVTDAQTTFVLPDGTRLTEADIASRDDIELVEEFCTPTRRVFAFEPPLETVETWDVEISGVSGEITRSLFVENAVPTFSFDAVSGEGTEPLSVGYTLGDADSEPSVRFFLDDDQDGADGVPISDWLAASDNPYVTIPTDFESGTYYLYAEVTDDYNVATTSIYADPISLTSKPKCAVSDTFARFTTRLADATETETVSFIIENWGNGPLHISNITQSTNDLSAFEVEFVGQDNAIGQPDEFTIFSDCEAQIVVTLVGNHAGRKDLSIEFSTDDPELATVELTVMGTVTDPDIWTAIGTDDNGPVAISIADLINVDHGLSDGVTFLAPVTLSSTHGALSWNDSEVVFTPNETFRRESCFTYMLRDKTGSVCECGVRITNATGNTEPVLDPIPDQTVEIGSTLSFAAFATDAEGDVITYSLSGAPDGASIEEKTGRFRWTPNDISSLGTHVFDVVASDGHLASAVSVRVVVSTEDTDPPLLPGDLNEDGKVGSADLDLVRANWGAAVTPGDLSRGDASGDGKVGSADLDLVRANWGSTPAVAGILQNTDDPDSTSVSDFTGPRRAAVYDAVFASFEDTPSQHAFSSSDIARLAKVAWLHEIESLRQKNKSRDLRTDSVSHPSTAGLEGREIWRHRVAKAV